MMRRYGIAILFLALCACSTNPPPAPPPSTYELSVVVISPYDRLGGATVTVDGRAIQTNEHGWMKTTVTPGEHSLQATAPEYQPGSLITYTITRHTRKVLLLEPIAPRPPPLHRLTVDGPIFRSDGEPWRWRGVTAFPLLDRFARGDDLEPLLTTFRGFNLLRVFWYVTWPGTGWGARDAATVRAFCNRVGQAGFYVELVLLTDDDPGRLEPARQLVRELSADPPINLLIEIGNEPNIHKNIDVWALRDVLDASPFLYASGDNERNPWFGRYLTAHTPRDSEWPRKAHDLLEYYHGGGPSAPSDPAHHVPIVADEPIRPDEAGYVDSDFLAYFATSSLLGAGATFHYDGGKFGRVPTGDEARCMQAALAGLLAFPADAPLGPYSRIDEQGNSLRTYKVGPYVVRIRPRDGVVIP